MYRLQVCAHTQVGDRLALIGSTPELGEWNLAKSIALYTDSRRYPLWWTEINLHQPGDSKIEYKYVIWKGDGSIQWESGETNRWIPRETSSETIIVEDGWFNCIQPYPYGYWQYPQSKTNLTPIEPEKTILVLGSSVALGCSAWLLKGWAEHLGETLQKRYGYRLINRSILGANVNTIIEQFPQLVGNQAPKAIIVALSLGNEGFAYCPPEERERIQQRFETGLQQLIKMIRDRGSQPILGGVYPHGDYNLDHYLRLEATRQRMLTWGVPVFDWLGKIHDGMGKWGKGLSFDVAHPNTRGHELMFEAIAPEILVQNYSPNILPPKKNLIFKDGPLEIYREHQGLLSIINYSPYEYNVHPMWTEASQALQRLTTGIYEDPYNRDLPFRTLMIGTKGLESRVKIPPQSLVYFQYQCPLKSRQRIAIIPLGDRCAVRMALYKIGLDGPAFPFDLTRTTDLGDIAEIIANNFEDMWNPNLLFYNAAEKRIYHRRWWGLSFAHEVEEHENPLVDMSPIFARMKKRYQSRAARFQYAIAKSDQLLFVRTGGYTAQGIQTLWKQLEKTCQGKPFRLLLLSPQESPEISTIPGLYHYAIEFNPDRMYADLGHWLYCAEVLRTILASLGVDSKNLFWCPPQVPQLATAALGEHS